MSSASEFSNYIARFFDLDAKIVQFNQVHIDGLSYDRELVNPYYGKEVPVVDMGRLCFSGPIEDTRNLRCLAISLEGLKADSVSNTVF